MKDLFEYQKHAADHVYQNPYCGLFMEMGLGKTISTLVAIKKLMYEDFSINKVLVIAPLQVAATVWDTEIADPDWRKYKIHWLKVSKILGTAKQRREALRKEADIYVINCENIPWLVTELQSNWCFDMVVFDEISKFKNHQAVRFKAMKVVRPLIKRVVGLTGTPSPNGLIDIWAPMYLIDRGERLGKSVSEFRVTYFSPAIQEGYVVYKYAIQKGKDKLIYDKIKDICISMSQKDYLELPPLVQRVVPVKLPDDMMAKYNEFEATQVMKLMEELDNDANNITAVTAAALMNKLLQFSNGAVYDENKKWHHVHDTKLDVLEELIEANEGQNILVFYSFKHDAERILRRFKHAVKLEGKEQIDLWNKGKIKLMIAHPASAGHGLNLQTGGHIIVWFGLNWSLELFQQANKRLHRPGQLMPVMIFKLLTKGTVDRQVQLALERKEVGQAALMGAVKVLIGKYLKAA